MHQDRAGRFDTARRSPPGTRPGPHHVRPDRNFGAGRGWLGRAWMHDDDVMSTITQYAAQLARGDIGRWQQATMRAADLLALEWDAEPSVLAYPDQEIQMSAAALLVYAIASQRDVPATRVSSQDVLAWLPDTTSVTELSQFSEPLLEHALRAAGHALGEQGFRIHARASVDPVVAQWQRQVSLGGPYRPDYEESAADAPERWLIWSLVGVRGVLNRHAPNPAPHKVTPPQ